jgi:dTDP-4-dehydrorhamnose 3,5-epimerase
VPQRKKNTISMIFHETKIVGVVQVELDMHMDERGFFARCWCAREMGEHGLNANLAQCSISSNRYKGTLRGMHYQSAPCQEAKLVRCTKGSLYDVALDLRALSATYMQWVGIELTETNHRALYVPEGCAHGFLTLSTGTEVMYLISEFYNDAAAQGVRWNDPSFKIVWPEAVNVISARDQNYTDFVAQ